MKFEQYSTREGKEVRIPVPTSYGDCIKLLQSDYFRMYGRTDNLLRIWLKSYRNRPLKYLFWMRLSAYKGAFYRLCKFWHDHYKIKYDCRIHSDSRIGYGLYIGHALSMCVNARCVIGNNVNLSHLINIGSNHNKQAIISDNVYIGPMSCLIEDVHVGHNSVIGAGSVVTKDIPSDSTAVGNPCRVIGPNRHPEYIHNRWKIDV